MWDFTSLEENKLNKTNTFFDFYGNTTYGQNQRKESGVGEK